MATQVGGLPSSSGNLPAPSSDAPRARHRGSDEAQESGDEEAQPGRRRPKTLRPVEDIPRVRDETGERVREAFESFVEAFVDEDDAVEAAEGPRRYYIDQIEGMREFETATLYVDFSHLLNANQVLAQAIQGQYYRFLPYLRIALQNLVKKYAPDYLYSNAHSVSTTSAGLQTREFAIAFYNLALVSGIRDLRTEKIGQLVSISGTVTRTSEVRPELVYGTFVCQECRTTVRDVEQQFRFTEPTVCPNLTCANRSAWQLSMEQSKFNDWQRVRIQENANEIPTGSMPRSLDVVLRAEIVERAKAGDKCVFTGTFIVVPDVAQLGLPGVNAEMMRESAGRGSASQGAGNFGVTGLKALGVRDLTYKTAFLACMVQSADSRGTPARDDEDDGLEGSRQQLLDSLTREEVDELQEMVSREDIYDALVNSIAPTVWGHEIVKKGILLQLMGGVHKQTKEGMSLRGDLNICIVGDPSVSKSQFLKYVCGFLPRSVYTSGKASSAAGLTAAVVKDEETGEFTIEAGALMLADNGICAIDEFDKMDVADQVAIHEAMEQQTISIAKAGIQATLNARTSILAAANPVGGRYNRKVGLRANVAMSAPIMSRFDLFFVVLDECNEDIDLRLAKHIVRLHQFRDTVITPEFSTDALQRYIRYARTFQPKLTPAASKVLVEKYRQLREDDAAGQGARNTYRITVRQLESLIRLSEAIARANCQDDITPAFVREAYSLLRQSIIHVEKDDVNVGDESDDEEEQPAASQAPTSPTPHDASPAPAARKQKIVITFDEYTAIMTRLVQRLLETEAETGSGLRRNELIMFYTESIEDTIPDEEALAHQQRLADRVISRLVKESILMEVRGEGLAEGDAEAMDQDGDAESTMLLVHPDSAFNDAA